MSARRRSTRRIALLGGRSGARQDHRRRPIARPDAQSPPGRSPTCSSTSPGLPSSSGRDEAATSSSIGACVTHADIEDGRIPDVTRGAMRRVARGIAYRAVRNRGTIGGWLSHADPAADWISALPALGAQVDTAQPGRRSAISPIEDFVTARSNRASARRNRRGRACSRSCGPSARWGYSRACRKPGEFAHAIAAVLIDPDAASARAGDRRDRGAADRSDRRDAAIRRDASPAISRRRFDARVADALADQRRHDRRRRPADSRCRPAPRRRRGRGMTTIASPSTDATVSRQVEPRTHLADFLRDTLDLTGTHLGCEHGVCGACTLLIDGAPARSCITFAVACDGADVTTIEGLDDDEIAAELRAAFSARACAAVRLLHAGHADLGARPRAAPAGRRTSAHPRRHERQSLPLHRLCRHRARDTLGHRSRRGRGIAPVAGGGRQQLRTGRIGPWGVAESTGIVGLKAAVADEPPGDSAALLVPDFVPDKNFDEHFTVAFPPDQVFDMFGDVARVAACLPGAALTATPAADRAEGQINVKLGPISANFRGAVRIERDAATLSGRIIGIGDDRRSRSSTQGDIRYRLLPLDYGPRRASNFRSATACGAFWPRSRARGWCAISPNG